MGWSEPQMPPSGIPGVRRGQTLSPGHQAWQRWHDPAVWGTMAGFGRHNPFLGDHDPEADTRWRKSRTHRLWTQLQENNPPMYQAASSAMSKHIRTARAAVAISTPALHGVLDSGKIKSGFETNRNSGGDLSSGSYLGMRREQEQDHFGYPADHSDAGRPVYGFLTHNVFSDRSASMYGAHTLVLSPSIHHRVTWSADDSLNTQDHVRPSPKNAPRLSSFPAHHADTRNQPPDLGVGSFLGSHEHRYGYLEAQIHGGLPLHHVHYAILRSPTTFGHPDDEVRGLQEQLNGHGVPWVHISGHSEAGPEHAVAWDEGSTRRRLGVLMTAYAAIVSGAYGAPHHGEIYWHQGHTRFIVELAAPGARGLATGQVADIEWGMLHPPMPIDSILARGYWQRLPRPIDAADILAQVRPVT